MFLVLKRKKKKTDLYNMKVSLCYKSYDFVSFDFKTI